MKTELNHELLVAIGAVDCAGIGAADHISFDAVTADSRQVRPGSVFVAINGTTVNGHTFIQAAIDAGATVIVCEVTPTRVGGSVWPVIVTVRDSRLAISVLAAAVEGNPTVAMKLTGITGTDGKTSTAMVMEAGYKGCGLNPGLLGTVTYRYAGIEHKSNLTTPDPVTLQKYFGEMKTAGVDAVAMEVSSHAIDQRRVEPCMFACGIFTNLTRDHLDYHVTPEAYKEAKMRFFVEVIPRNPNAAGVVVNDDDPVSAEIRRRCPLKVIGWTLCDNPVSEIRLTAVNYSLDGTSFDFVTPWGTKHVDTHLAGRHNVANIMAATGAAGLLGLPLDHFLTGACSLRVIPGRLERVASPNSRRVFVDYAHTPKAIEAILGILRPLVGKGRLCVICGAGGDRDRGKRPLMGRAAVMSADVAWITSDNPRSEEPLAIIDEIVGGIRESEADGTCRAVWSVEPDRRLAIERAITSAGPDDVIVIAGKGHEDYQILKDQTIHFSDVEVAREVLGK